MVNVDVAYLNGESFEVRESRSILELRARVANRFARCLPDVVLLEKSAHAHLDDGAKLPPQAVWVVLKKAEYTESEWMEGIRGHALVGDFARAKQLARELRQHGSTRAEAFLQRKWGQAALVWAARREEAEICQQLLGRGAAPDAEDIHGFTALHVATQCGRLEVCEQLMLRGTDPRVPAPSGWQALHTAALRGHHEICAQLIARGADPQVATSSGCTALHWAAFAGHLEVCNLLISHGADPSVANNVGRTALMCAASADRFEVCALLIDQKADPGATDLEKTTALHQAADNGYLEVCALLLACGANPNAEDEKGKTALAPLSQVQWKPSSPPLKAAETFDPKTKTGC